MQTKGMAVYDQDFDGYGNDLIFAQLEKLATLGVNYVSFTVYFDMTTYDSNSLHYAGYNPDKEHIRAFIRKAHELGLRVMFKPHVSCEDGRWAGRIYPTDWNAWFTSYTTLLVEYAQLCQEEGVEIICVGNELSSSTGSDEHAPYPHAPNNRNNWMETIIQVRSVFSGGLTYAATDWQVLDDSFPFDLVDYVGCNPYFRVSDSLTDTVDQIVENWTLMSDTLGRIVTYSNWKSKILALKSKYGKPLLFTEVAYYRLFSNVHTTFPNEQEQQWQANCYEALFKVWNNLAHGVFWWEWCSPERPIATKARWVYNMGPQDKLAQNIVQTWYEVMPTPPITTLLLLSGGALLLYLLFKG